MKALLFGSIGVVVDASSLQREAYNLAFEEEGLGWSWDAETYEGMLTVAGGRARMRLYAERDGGEVPSEETIGRVHARKTALFDAMLDEGRAPARPGVRRLIDAAHERGVKLGFVTSTELDNVEAILRAADIERSDFDIVTHRGNVEESKPDPAPYLQALEHLHVGVEEAVAIEDTEICLQSVIDAGIAGVVTPNASAGGQDFSAALAVVDHLGDHERAARTLAGHDIARGGLVTLDSLGSLLEREAELAPA